MPTNEELIDEIQLGSQAAMEVLVKRHYQYIYLISLKRLAFLVSPSCTQLI